MEISSREKFDRDGKYVKKCPNCGTQDQYKHILDEGDQAEIKHHKKETINKNIFNGEIKDPWS